MDTEVLTEQTLTRQRAEDSLCRRLAQGDTAAYEELWGRFAPGLLRFGTARLGGDKELAEDIALQTLAAAVRSLASFNPHRATLAQWLYGIIRRILIAELRKQRRRAEVPKSAEVNLEKVCSVAADGDLASDLAARLEAQRKALLLARHLSEAEMEILLLHYVEEFSLKEIAPIVGRSERAVYSLLHRAKVKARERLAQDDAGK
jgi:RNA polymerase sigma-70 factor, ECF subfamily